LALGESINEMEKDMESTGVDQNEMRDLRNVKRRLKEVDDASCMMQEEVGHSETKHCKKV
jgi:hypothetical protein